MAEPRVHFLSKSPALAHQVLRCASKPTELRLTPALSPEEREARRSCFFPLSSFAKEDWGEEASCIDLPPAVAPPPNARATKLPRYRRHNPCMPYANRMMSDQWNGCM